MALISLGIFGSVVPDVIRKRYAAKLGVAFLLVILVIAAVGGVIFLQTEETLAADANQELEQSARMPAPVAGTADEVCEHKRGECVFEQ